MRVLIFSKFTPYPPTAGGLTRMWTLAKTLKKCGIQVEFIVPVFRSPRTTVQENITIHEVKLSPIYVIIGFLLHKALPQRIGLAFHYLFLILYFERNLERKMQELSKGVDIIQCEFVWLYRIPNYVSHKKNLPFLLTFHDINSLFLSDYIKPTDRFSKFLIKKVLDAEIAAYKAADGLVSFTEKDFKTLVDLGVPKEKIKVIPHGIAKLSINPTLSNTRPIVVYVGSGHLPNVQSAEIIIAKFAPEVPEVDFFIVGNVASSLKRFKKPANVIVTGFLSEKELIRLYNMAALAIVPLLSGAGMSVKTVEFLAAGLPVLTTSIGARGMEAAFDKIGALIINDNLSEYPLLIKRLVKSPDLRKSWSEKAKQIYSDSAIRMGEDYVSEYNRLLEEEPNS